MNKFVCPYCGKNKSNKELIFKSWTAVTTRTRYCNKYSGEYIISHTTGPVHYTTLITVSIDKLKNIYGKSKLRNMNKEFKKRELITTNIYKKYSKQDCINAIQKVAKNTGRTPTNYDFRKTGGNFPSAWFITTVFGSWNNALKVAGYSTVMQGTAYEDCSEKGCINAIQRFYLENNRIPQLRDFEANPNYPSYKTVSKHFSTWNNAIEIAGYAPNIQNGYGIRTYGLDGMLYRSRAETYFADNFLYEKFDYDIEPKYPKQYNKYYDWYIPSLDLYIELDGGIRPETIRDKIEINKQLNRDCLIISTKDIYNKKKLENFINKKEI